MAERETGAVATPRCNCPCHTGEAAHVALCKCERETAMADIAADIVADPTTRAALLEPAVGDGLRSVRVLGHQPTGSLYIRPWRCSCGQADYDTSHVAEVLNVHYTAALDAERAKSERLQAGVNAALTPLADVLEAANELNAAITERYKRAAAAIAAARALHVGERLFDFDTACRECEHPWPCPTVAALETEL